MTLHNRRLMWTAVLAAWALSALGGMTVLMGSSFQPDAPADAHGVWPVALDLPRPPGRPTLVVCLHPRCPCSDATLESLITLVGTSTDFDLDVLFAVPPGAGLEWTNTKLIARARQIDGMKVLIDTAGRRCAALGARTSGQAFLYDVDGRLAFTGGITPARGERGDSTGLHVLNDAFAGRPLPAVTVRTAVFGCALYRPHEAVKDNSETSR